MTRPFAGIERFFERLFERPAARLFHTPVQPIQVQRKLERAMDTGRVFSGDRTYVPNRYRVRLNPEDARAFDGYRPTLETELADALHARARSRGYRLLARPSIAIEASSRIAVADIDVVADVIEPHQLKGLNGRPQPAGPTRTGVFGAVDVPPAPAPVTAVSVPYPSSDFAEVAPIFADATVAFPSPGTSAPLARIEVRTHGVVMGAHEFRSGTMRVGRASSNEIVLIDDRASRHHGQFSSRQGTLVYSDLGSTNGSFVNGTRVREIVLGSGDVVRLGNSTLTIQPHA